MHSSLLIGCCVLTIAQSFVHSSSPYEWPEWPEWSAFWSPDEQAKSPAVEHNVETNVQTNIVDDAGDDENAPFDSVFDHPGYSPADTLEKLSKLGIDSRRFDLSIIEDSQLLVVSKLCATTMVKTWSIKDLTTNLYGMVAENQTDSDFR